MRVRAGAAAEMINEFTFATGIECSYPKVQGGLRRDMLEETGHYRRWKDDLRLVKELGICTLRYGPPYYCIHLGPERYDWEFTDQVFGEMQALGIEPIVDLLHFGLPDWLGDFQNPDFPQHFAAYAVAFAKRYPWVQWYTPVNEIYLCARASTLLGFWNERIRTHRAFVTALKHLCKASVLMMSTVQTVCPGAVFMQSETAQFTHARTLRDQPKADLCNELRFAALDLHYARQVQADVLLYLMDNGMTRQEYEWFMHDHSSERAILGIDYYKANEAVIDGEGELVPNGETFGWYVVARHYYDRYRRPLMQSETNMADPEEAPHWLWKQWHNVWQIRRDGVPIVGFTWYGLTDIVDWEEWMVEKAGKVVPCGLYDLDRRPRSVCAEFRKLVREYRGLPILRNNPVFGIADHHTEAPKLE
jgi:beta-glucosidase/6-phospho-beta-glucosidase/beta-galactosidase